MYFTRILVDAIPDSFLQSAAKEVQDNVRRLQFHPSIAIWAGNNEDEHDMYMADKRLPPNGMTPADIAAYSELTFRTELANISAIDTSRPLSGSSPSDGNETAEHPWSWNHQSEFYGDVHCYLYDSDNWDFTSYKRPRFMSEFGLQSWPSALTMSEVFPTSEWSYDSDMSINRNHHPDGQDQMLQQIAMHFHLPPTSKLSSYVSWSYMLWLTQVNQAQGYKNEVEHFRRIRTDCSETVPGCNMGRMYWQTNDIWQGASWAAIDYTGRWKMVQYFTKRFYAPFLTAAFGTAVHGRFRAYIINDYTVADWHITGELRFTMHSWASGPIGSWFVRYDSPPGTAIEVHNSSWSQMLAAGNCDDATDCFLMLEAFDGSASDGHLLSTNYLLLSPFFDVTSMQNPNLTVVSIDALDRNNASGVATGEDAFAVAIHADAPAAYAWVETKWHGRWSDNGILIPRAGTTELIFYSDRVINGNITAKDIHNTLKAGKYPKVEMGGLWSLYDTSSEYGNGVYYPAK